MLCKHESIAAAEITQPFCVLMLYKAPSQHGRPLVSSRLIALAGRALNLHARAMFVVSEAEATAIRAAFDRGGELSAAVELRRLFPGITDNVQARECARTIAGWKPLPVKPRTRRSRRGCAPKSGRSGALPDDLS
jgi:hypothetical protein